MPLAPTRRPPSPPWAGPIRLHAEPLPSAAERQGPAADEAPAGAAADAVGAVAAALVRAGQRGVVALSGAWAGGGGLVTAAPRYVRRPLVAADAYAVTDLLPTLEGAGTDGVRVGGGWFGYLGYGLSGTLRRTPPAEAPVRLLPVAHWGWHDWVLRLDPDGQWWFEALLGNGFGADAAARARATALAALAQAAGPGPVRVTDLAAPDRTRHCIAVEDCVRAIRRGDVFQANITAGFDLALDGAPVDAWHRLVAALAPARAAFVDVGEGAVVSASPELFLARRGSRVVSEPIKGTVPRGEAAERVLRGSGKDVAENVMIVDLVRNDLSAVCRPGTVEVTGLLDVAPHTGVWHLVSRVEGELAPGRGSAALLAATFPPASVTGVPKVRALEVMADAEGAPRGVYTGAVGFASPVAGLELNVAIRTLEVVAGRGRLGVGGGVTAGSTPVEEWAECLVKAAPLLTALGASSAGSTDAVRAAARVPPARDRARGLAETVLVRDGTVLEAADHAARLERSWWELRREPLPIDARAVLARAAARLPRGWHRLQLEVPAGGTARTASAPVAAPADLPGQPGVEVEVAVLAAAAAGAAGAAGSAGLPRHAFADRRELTGLEARGGGEGVVTDPDGCVLGSTGANVLAVIAGRVHTAPLDGRVLPGVTRQVLLDLAADLGLPVTVAPLPLAVAARADAVLLCDSVRGVRWVRAGLGRRWEAPDAVATALARRLLDRWGAA